VDVQLGHQIADPGDVDLGTGQHPRQVIRDPLAIGQYPMALEDGEIQQIAQIGLGDQDEPGHLSVAVEQQVAMGQFAERVTVDQELRVEGEGVHEAL
jgi:hypothetical protein